MKYRNDLSNKLSLASLVALLCLLISMNSCSKKDNNINSNKDNLKNDDNNTSVTTNDIPEYTGINKMDLYESLIKHNIPFIKLDGFYYTLNGDKIVFYVDKQKLSPIEIIVKESDGTTNKYLEAPEGSVLEGDKAYRYVTNFIILTDEVLLNTIDYNSIIEIVETRPYSDLLIEKNYELKLEKK